MTLVTTLLAMTFNITTLLISKNSSPYSPAIQLASFLFTILIKDI